MNIFLNVPIKEQILLARNIALMSHAGMPLLETLKMVQKQSRSRSLKKILDDIIHQVEKADTDLLSPSKVIIRILKKYIKDGTKVTGEVCQECGQETLVRVDGCINCKSCGWSKCN